MYNTILLDPATWDLTVNSSGNIAMASPPYALAQDVASALKLFEGELYYDISLGVPYFSEILGELPPPAIITARMETAAYRVSGVTDVQVVIQSLADRTVTGQVQFIDETGALNGVTF